MEKQEPKYAQTTGEYGGFEYSYIVRLCRRCGYTIEYDDVQDDGTDSTIHMGDDSGYSGRKAAEYDLAKKLSERIYGKLEQNRGLLAGLGLPDVAPTWEISREMIINSFADYILTYALLAEVRGWCH